MLRHVFAPVAILVVLCTHGQSARTQAGKPFQRALKNATGDIYTLVDGILLNDHQALLYVEDGLDHKVVRTGADLAPTDELVLKDHAFDGLLWNGVAPIIIDGTMHCLMVSTGKRSTQYAIGQVDLRGPPALSALRQVASTTLPHHSDPTHVLVTRTQPNSILFSKGLAFAHTERIVGTPDGRHFLLNNYTHNERGEKQFWFAYLDKDLNEQWSGTATLPYQDSNSRIHQIGISNDGTIHLLAYVFKCATEEQMGDKLCHEMHFTTISDRGRTVKDVLVDKDFVSTVRFCERDSGRVSMAIRYGALTGQPGWVITFDPMDPRLKSTPLVDQRVPSIRKTRLMAYGSIEPGAKKSASSRTAKVPNEIVDLMPAWNGGLVVVETFLETSFEVPMGEAIAMRRLCGDVRATFVAANDSIQWQHVTERAFMTTAGQAYEGVDIHLNGDGVTLLYDHTPKGLDAIMLSGSEPTQGGEEKGKGKKERVTAPVESGVLKAVTIDPRGTVVRQGTLLLQENGLLPCPMNAIAGASGNVRLVKRYDRNTTYDLSLVDVTKLAP